MAILEVGAEKGISKQLEALQEERNAIQKNFDSGSISKAEYRKNISKIKFQEARLKEQNKQRSNDRKKTHERGRSFFND